MSKHWTYHTTHFVLRSCILGSVRVVATRTCWGSMHVNSCATSWGPHISHYKSYILGFHTLIWSLISWSARPFSSRQPDSSILRKANHTTLPAHCTFQQACLLQAHNTRCLSGTAADAAFDPLSLHIAASIFPASLQRQVSQQVCSSAAFDPLSLQIAASMFPASLQRQVSQQVCSRCNI
jgi:hypothetical protein